MKKILRSYINSLRKKFNLHIEEFHYFRIIISIIKQFDEQEEKSLTGKSMKPYTSLPGCTETLQEG
jgi:hypothetical protein